MQRVNPIVMAELLHQERAIDSRRQRWWILVPRILMLVGAMGITAFFLMLQAGESLGLFRLWLIAPQLHVLAFLFWIVIPGITLLPSVVMMHFGLIIRTLLWTTDSIPREKRTGTWDLLLLTGVSARKLVMGKYWATVRRALPSYVRLAVLRIGLVLWVIELSRLWFRWYPSFEVIVNDYYEPAQLRFLAAGIVLLVIMTLLNLLFTAAVGVFTSFIARRAAITFALAVVIRTGICLLPIAIWVPYMLFGFRYPYQDYGNYYNSLAYVIDQILQILMLSLADNGSSLSGSLMQMRVGNDFADNYTNLILPGSVVVLILYYIVMTGALLGLARVLASRQFVLPPERRRPASKLEGKSDAA